MKQSLALALLIALVGASSAHAAIQAVSPADGAYVPVFNPYAPKALLFQFQGPPDGAYTGSVTVWAITPAGERVNVDSVPAFGAGTYTGTPILYRLWGADPGRYEWQAKTDCTVREFQSPTGGGVGCFGGETSPVFTLNVGSPPAPPAPAPTPTGIRKDPACGGLRATHHRLNVQVANAKRHLRAAKSARAKRLAKSRLRSLVRSRTRIANREFELICG